MAHPLNPMTFPLNGSRLMEASAGTGKTYTIAALYLRLVLGHGGDCGFGRPLHPREILVVTFTNAATEELRHRIFQRLTQAAAVFRGLAPGDDHLNALRDHYLPEMRPGKAQMLEQAARYMDEAAITTIHAWAGRMLRQHAVDSGCLFDMELSADDRDLMEEAACDYWRHVLYPLPTELTDDFLSLTGTATPEAFLEKTLPFMKGPPPETEDPVAVLKKRRQAIENARLAWETDFETPAGLIRAARESKHLNGNQYRANSLETWLAAIRAWVFEKAPLPDAAALLKCSTTGLARGTSKSGTPPEHPAFDALDALNTALETLDPATSFMVHAAGFLRAQVEREKERSGIFGFDDLLTRLSQALSGAGGKRLAGLVRTQFPVAMIDEFQDTDPVQYACFREIYLDRSDAALLMIGDPKQAIYSFRGADIHTYLKARSDTRESLYTLDCNYRSASGMVEAVNRMFSFAASHPKGAFLFEGKIDFEPVRANGRDTVFVVEGRPAPAMTLWHLDQDVPVKKSGADGYYRQTAMAAAGEIARLLDLAAHDPENTGFCHPLEGTRPVRARDIAVLVRSGREAAIIRDELSRLGVRSVYLSDRESVFDSREAKSLLYILRACAEPSRENFIRTALATDTLSLSLERLDALIHEEEAWEDVLECFFSYSILWQNQGVLPMIRKLLNDFNVPSALLAQPGGERRLTNLLHLSELLQAEAMKLDGSRALVRWLSERIESRDAGSDETIIRLETDDALVRVITIHKSKGLEYPLVFLPFVCAHAPVRGGGRPVIVHESDGRARFVIRPDTSALEKADTERLAEDMRLLYVAMTRARHATWAGIGVLGSMTRQGEKSQSHKSAMGYLLAGGEPIPAAGLAERLRKIAADGGDIAVVPLPGPGRFYPVDTGIEQRKRSVRTFTGTVSRSWTLSSYSGLIAGAGSHGPYIDDPDESGAAPLPESAAEDQLLETPADRFIPAESAPRGRSIHGFPRGPEPGTFLHDILEWAAGEGFSRAAANPGLCRDTLTALCRRKGYEPWTSVIMDWFLSLLGTPLALPGGAMRLADLEAGSCRAEMEFLFAAGDVDTRELDRQVTASVIADAPRPALESQSLSGMFKGFIDLVFEYQGRYWVMDYKSNHLGENENAYTREAMTAAMLDHRYDLQYVLYTLALHRLLKHRLPGYDYRTHVGGVAYLFLRGVTGSGNGVFTDTPPPELIDRLDRLFSGIKEPHDT